MSHLHFCSSFFPVPFSRYFETSASSGLNVNDVFEGLFEKTVAFAKSCDLRISNTSSTTKHHREERLLPEIHT